MKWMLASKEDTNNAKSMDRKTTFHSILFAHSSSYPTRVFVSPVAQSSPPRRPIFTSPVAPSSPRPSPRLRLARRPVFASPVAPSSPRPSPRLRLARRLVIAPSSPRHCGSGSAVLPNGLYAMGGTVAQAVWLKVDRRGNAPLGTPPLSMR
ncbi:hypothetical protein OUZ56_031945 [Daphnia magna]|uniref:Uncharacterized protein n=1 Tax=Daphnia magna TaxID=35525 RepID=A0ABQ9ZVP6_9CRUS|nr:hypothetical protein OUZ56_031945 [Daphnia magna]